MVQKTSIIRFFTFLALALPLPLSAQSRDAQEPPFCPGEYLEYQVYFSIIHAGTAVMSVDESVCEMNGAPCYRLHVRGTSNDALALLGFKIDNVWETYLEVQGLRPRKFLAHIQENKYVRKECIDFDYQKNQARIEVVENTPNAKPEISYCPIPSTIQDLLGGYYSLRQIDTTRLKPGDVLHISVLHHNRVYADTPIVFLGKKVIVTKLGEAPSLVFAPLVPTESSIFTGARPIEVFISDDVNKIPLKLKAHLMIGSVDIELTCCRGLKTEIPFQIP